MHDTTHVEGRPRRRRSRSTPVLPFTNADTTWLFKDCEYGSIEQRFLRNVKRLDPDECWPWLGMKAGRGYGRMKIQGRTFVVTRIALLLDGRIQPSSKHIACHTCDNPICCNPSHLWWGTNKENTQDAVRKGRLYPQDGSRWTFFRTPEAQVIRSRLGKATRSLSNEQVIRIRALADEGVSQRAIARDIGSSLKTVWAVIKRERYSEIS